MNRKKFVITFFIFLVVLIVLGLNFISNAETGNLQDVLGVTDEDLKNARKNETWDDFYIRFRDNISVEGGKNLNNVDLIRMYIGCTDDERYGGSGEVYGSQDQWQDFSNQAGELASTRNQNGGAQVGNDEEKWKSLYETAKKLYERAQDKKNSKEVRLYSAKACRNRLVDLRAASESLTSQNAESINTMEADMKALIEELTGEKEETGLYDEQLGNDGEISDPEEKIWIFKWPSLSEKSEKKDGSLDSMITDAEDFVKTGDEEKINIGEFQTLSARIYNIVLQIGIGLSVIIGLILGIKFMLSSPTEKAEVTKMLKVYVIACIVIFGSFGIWKLLVTLFSQI